MEALWEDGNSLHACGVGRGTRRASPKGLECEGLSAATGEVCGAAVGGAGAELRGRGGGRQHHAQIQGNFGLKFGVTRSHMGRGILSIYPMCDNRR